MLWWAVSESGCLMFHTEMGRLNGTSSRTARIAWHMHSHFAGILYRRLNRMNAMPIMPTAAEMPSILKRMSLIIGITSVKLIKEGAKLADVLLVEVVAVVKAGNKAADRVAVQPA